MQKQEIAPSGVGLDRGEGGVLLWGVGVEGSRTTKPACRKADKGEGGSLQRSRKPLKHAKGGAPNPLGLRSKEIEEGGSGANREKPLPGRRRKLILLRGWD